MRASLPDVLIHDLRHTFASSGIALGQGLPIIGKLLGHSQPQKTARYAHLAASPALEFADKISKYLAAIIEWKVAGAKQIEGVVIDLYVLISPKAPSRAYHHL
jgi:Phage integrase family